MSYTVKYFALSLLIAGLFLSACTPALLQGSAVSTPSTPSPLGDSAEATVFVAATETVATTPSVPPATSSTPSPSPEAQAASPQSSPSPFPDCASDLTYLADLTLPDGSTVQPGELLDKRWQVENSGTCNWGRDYRLKLIAGDEMGAAVEQALYPARAGVQAVIELHFIAPSEPGLYRSAWQAYDPQDQPFGDPIFVDIVVASP